MGSFTSKEIVDDIIAHNGRDPQDPPIPQCTYVKIVEYTSPEGQTTWGAVLEVEVGMGMADRYDKPTDYILNPKVIWMHPTFWNER